MLRGTLVIFAGALTILLLKRSLYAHNWLGMVLICAGAALVGASSVIYDDSGSGSRLAAGGGEGGVAQRLLALVGVAGASPGAASRVALGNLMVVAAQVSG